jgi:citrate synthase
MAAASVEAHPGADPAHVVLARGWRRPRATAAIRLALVLCADHELNASAFTARCAASTAATPYAALIAALAALTGPRHGGATRKVEDLLDLPAIARDPAEAVAERLRLGEPLPGFGHALYPEGDPRAIALLACADAQRGSDADLSRAHAVAAAALRLSGLRPNLDFGLVTLCRRLGLPRGAPLAIFLVGRTVGWLAHALEQYASDRLIRPRARYVGPPPDVA